MAFCLQSLAPKCEFTVSNLLWIPTKRLARCGGLSMALVQLKDSSELVVKRREFLLGSGFLACRDKTFLLSLATEKYEWYFSKKKENMHPSQSPPHPQLNNPNLLKVIRSKV